MNTAKIKAYAVEARRDFIKAVTERANVYGIFSDDHIEPLEVKGDTAIIAERAFPKKEGELREKLVARVKKDGFARVMGSAAYTWFNRFVALRYMELHDYLDHGYRVLSGSNGSDVPEIIEHAAEVDLPGIDKQQVISLKLAGTRDNELYRLLILAQCDALHQSMPFLFESIESETELLLPDNLLFSDSPIRKLVTLIDESAWNDVEIIGWIYQFYISERKDEVIGKVVKSEDIPAATQLFTPNWIVKYMLHNTLGRMWLATYPDSALKDKMAYYIVPAAQAPEVQKQLDEITPKALNPEAITLLDPACGSGHILVEAYDIFKEIYRERGYRTRDIPRLILKKNLYGLDIDERAAQLACFAVLMKARADDRRIFQYKDLKLNVQAVKASRPADLRNIELFFKGAEYQALRADLQEIAALFENAKTFGSLITIPPHLVTKMPAIQAVVEEKIGKWVSKSDVQNLRALVQQAVILARQYDCVVTNPPYMGSKGLNLQLKDFAKNRFPASKSDLFAMFIERGLDMVVEKGYAALVTMQSWMFLSSYKALREKLLDRVTIECMVHMANMVMGIAFGTAATIWQNINKPKFKGHFSYVYYEDLTAENKPKQFPMRNDRLALAAAADFKKIPGSPIAYWVSERVRALFPNSDTFELHFDIKAGISTGKNEVFILYWSEVEFNLIRKEPDSYFAYVPHNKGGEFRKWMGNWDSVLKYSPTHIQQMEKNAGFRHDGKDYYFHAHIGWSKITSSKSSFRYYPHGFSFDSAGLALFSNDKDSLQDAIGFLNSKISTDLFQILNPTLNVTPQILKKLPLIRVNPKNRNIYSLLYQHSKKNWDSYETSWDFTTLPLLQPEHHQPTLKETCAHLRTHWHEMTQEMQRLEEENNRIFIEAYGLQDELTPDVPLSEITLTCNPHYRYNGNKDEKELETLLLNDTIKELISYAVGCMMGRYSLDEPGLAYAHSGNQGFDPSKYRTFPADDDGIIPVMDRDWFADDAAGRFVEFMQVAWPPQNLDENLEFIADCLKPKRNETPIDTIRRYLSTGFFKDHLKTYKKRPIYWLFSSGKQKAFECLVYLHRYNESTLSRMRSTYITPLQRNFSSRLEFLQNERDAASTASVKNKFQKEIDRLKKKQIELSKFDEELRHYADMKISLDLDDGVKVNYGKFGNLLAVKKAVTGRK